MKKAISIKDRNFAPDAFKPLASIIYDDALNAKLLELIRLKPVHYSNILRSLALEQSLSKHTEYKDLVPYIKECTKHLPKDQFRLSIRIFWILNKWQDFPTCEMPDCGIRLILDNQNQGFRLKLDKDGNLLYIWPRHCCNSHARGDPVTKQKFIDTCKERYGGVINVFQAEEIKERCKQTLLKKYGVDAPAKSPIILARMQESCLEKYGVDNYFKTQEIKDKVREPEILAKRVNHMMETMLERYGSPYYFTSDDFKQKVGSTNGTSKEERALTEYIKSLTNLEVQTNTFKVISPKQLDIYIPELKLAFEYNGTYYHSLEYRKDDGIEYHLYKTRRCEELGIKLVHIWENEWDSEQQLETKKLISDMILGNVKFDTTTDILELDRAKFNKAWDIPGYKLLEETPVRIIQRDKRDKSKYKVPDCGTLLYQRV